MFLQFLYFSSDSALLLFNNLIYSLCLVLKDFFNPLLNEGVFKFLDFISILFNGKSNHGSFFGTVCNALNGIYVVPVSVIYLIFK